jgi:uncharacterized repeat protein (TIGR03847 family)
MTERHRFEHVDTFTAAVEGRPGQRTFFLQVQADATVVTVKCEKQQVDALGQYFVRLLTTLEGQDQPEADLARARLEAATPLLAEFVVGSISVAFDADAECFVVDIEEAVPVDENGEPEPEALERQGGVQLRLDRTQAQAFAELAAELVAAGRPPCRFCGLPLDPEGHACPRMN